jgi:hypothetical protein
VFLKNALTVEAWTRRCNATCRSGRIRA